MSFGDIAQHRPIFGSNPPAYMPLGNFGQSGVGGLALQMIMPWLETQMRGHGLAPGQFMPVQGMLDQFRARQFQAAQEQVMRDASRLDRQTYQRFFTGVADFMGMQNNARRTASITQASGMLASVAPFIASVAPDAFDTAHGRRGSALVMATALHRAGQTMVDPFTGRTGMTADSTRMVSRELFNRLYGPDANLAEMRGLGAGRAGMLFEELSHRGLAGMGVGAMTDRQRLELLAAADPLSTGASLGVHSSVIRRQAGEARRQLSLGGELDMSKFDMGTVGDTLATFDAQRASSRLKDMSGAIAAMREIFGDAGHPNAPMAQLVAGLEALTQNGMVTMSPERLQQSVRRTQALATNVGVTMEGVLGLTAAGADRTDRLGLDRQFAVSATQNALAFGQAAGNLGRLDVPAYGSLDREGLMVADQRLRIAAANSPMANRMNAILRLASEGSAGGQAAEVAKMIREGRSDEVLKFVDNDESYRRLLAGSGVNEAMAMSALRATHANQGYGLEAGTADLARRLQRTVDIDPAFRSIYGDTARLGLSGVDMTTTQREAVTRAVGSASATALRGMSADQYRDTAKRNDLVSSAIEKSLRESLRAQGVNVPDAQIREMARDIAVGGWGRADEYFSRDPRFGGLGAMGVLQTQDPALARGQLAAMREADAAGAMRSALAGLGDANPFQRMVDAVSGAKPDTSLSRIALEIAGGIPAEDRAKVDPILQTLGALTRDFEGAARDGSGNLTAGGLATRETAARRIAALRSGGPAATAELAAIAKSLGLDVANLSPEAIRSKLGGADAEGMIRTVTALQSAIGMGGIDAYSEAAGFKIGKSVDDAERMRPQAILSSALADDMAVKFGDKSYRITDRNLNQFATLGAIASRHKDKLGMARVESPEEYREAVQRLLSRQGDESLGLGSQELLDIRSMQKQIEKEQRSNTLKIEGELSLKNMKGAMLDAVASSNDYFTGSGVPAPV